MREYLKLCRVEYAGFGYVALLGALCAGWPGIEPWRLAVVAVVNVLFLMWTFAHNDYCDLPTDRLAKELDERVLVKGTVTRRGAVLVVGAGVAFMIAASLLLRSAPASVVLAGSAALAMAYNAVSKRFLFADLLYAGSAALLCMFGVLAVSGAATLRGVPAIAWILVGLVFIEHLFFNMIEGGLKDVDLDQRCGARTFAVRHVRYEQGRLHPAPAFRAAAYALKILAALLAFAPFLALDEPSSVPQLALMAILAVVAVACVRRLLALPRYDWKAMGRVMVVQEMASRGLLPLMLLGRIGPAWVVAILAAPMVVYLATVWFLHGRLLALPKRF